MTAFERPDLPLHVERELREFLDGEARVSHPDYLSDILDRSRPMRQRPAWTFIERWLPMTVVTTRAVTPPRVPWRALAVIALLGILAAGALLVAGSRPHPPAPFGLASSGVIAYGQGGDIFTVDPGTGARSAIVTGSTLDNSPRFSRDGTRIAFVRETAEGVLLVVADVDGRHEAVLTPKALGHIDTDAIAWSPDGRTIAINATPAGSAEDAPHALLLVDTAGGGVRPLATSTPFVAIETYWRPPDGRQLLFMGSTGSRFGLFLASPETGAVEQVPVPENLNHLRPLGWTPDGRRLAYQIDDVVQGAGTRILDLETGTEKLLPVLFGHLSNDGTRVVGILNFAELCVMSIDGGPCKVLGDPRHLPDGSGSQFISWSPDDLSIVAVASDDSTPFLLRVDSGREEAAPWQSLGGASWQRR